MSLTKYLATLLAPSEGYDRRLLIPFSGAGSEIIGAELSGQWEHITGVEQSSDYCKIAEGRIAYWQGKTGLFNELNADGEEAADLQASLDDYVRNEVSTHDTTKGLPYKLRKQVRTSASRYRVCPSVALRAVTYKRQGGEDAVN